jgi:capsular polysaccharide biosynthesis protein
MPDLPIYTIREIAARPFQSILITSGCDTEGFLTKDIAAGMRTLAETVCAGADSNEKIYVSRLLSSTGRRAYRVLQNEPEVEKRAQARGYRVVYPETLSLAGQLKAFGTASHIFGPSGSGMLNTAFARTGTKVADLESFTNCVRQHAKLYCSSGKQFAFGFGVFASKDADEAPHVKSWTIPPSILSDVLGWLEE